MGEEEGKGGVKVEAFQRVHIPVNFNDSVILGGGDRMVRQGGKHVDAICEVVEIVKVTKEKKKEKKKKKQEKEKEKEKE